MARDALLRVPSLEAALDMASTSAASTFDGFSPVGSPADVVAAAALVTSRVENAKARAAAKVSNAKTARERAIITAQLNGKQGVFLAHEKKVVKFADQQNDQYNALVARDADTFPEIEHRALDKRVVNLVQQWKATPAGGSGVVAVTPSPDGALLYVGTDAARVGVFSAATGEATRGMSGLLPSLARAIRVVPAAPGHTRGSLLCGLDDASTATVALDHEAEATAAEAAGGGGGEATTQVARGGWAAPTTRMSPVAFRERATKSYEAPAAKWSSGRKKMSCRTVAMVASGERMFVGSPMYEDFSIFSWAIGGDADSGEGGEEGEDGEEPPSPGAREPDVMRVHTDKVQALLLSKDGSTLWSAAADKTIVQWDVKTLTIVRTLKGHTGGVKSLVLSPDESTLYSGGADKGIRAWEAATGLWLRTFVGGHSGFVTAMAVSADGQLLFTGCESTYGDGSVKVWRTGDGECVGVFKDQTKGINTLAVSHDGGVLYSGAGDGTLMAYHIQRDSRVLQKHGSSWKGGFL